MDSSEQTHESVYDQFWKGLVEKDGVVNMAQVKKELFDFWQLMENVPKVYCHVTGGHASKPLTDPNTVCSLADEHYRKLYEEYGEA